MNQDTQFRMTTARNALIGNAGTLTQLRRDFEAAALVLGDPQRTDDATTTVMIQSITAISEALAALDGKLTAVLKTLGTAPQQAQKSESRQQPQARKWEPRTNSNDPYSAFDDMFDK